MEWLIKTLENGECQVTSLPLNLEGGARRTWDSPSLDRIDPDKPYTMDNVKVVLWAINSANGTWGYQVAEMVAIARLQSRGYTVTQQEDTWTHSFSTSKLTDFFSQSPESTAYLSATDSGRISTIPGNSLPRLTDSTNTWQPED